MENYMTREESASERAVRRRDTEEALNEARCKLDETLDRLSYLEEHGMTEVREYDHLQDYAEILEDEIRECKEILREYC